MAQPLQLLPLVSRGGYPGMQRKTGCLRNPGAVLPQTILRQQRLQAKCLATLLWTDCDDMGLAGSNRYFFWATLALETTAVLILGSRYLWCSAGSNCSN